MELPKKNRLDRSQWDTEAQRISRTTRPAAWKRLRIAKLENLHFFPCNSLACQCFYLMFSPIFTGIFMGALSNSSVILSSRVLQQNLHRDHRL